MEVTMRAKYWRWSWASTLPFAACCRGSTWKKLRDQPLRGRVAKTTIMLVTEYSFIGRGRSGCYVKESEWLRGYFSAQGVGLCWIQKDSASASPGNEANQTHEVCSAGCNPASERRSVGLCHWTIVSCYPSNWPIAAPYELELLRLWLPLWPLCDPASVVCHPSA